jgi:hypothetical protein
MLASSGQAAQAAATGIDWLSTGVTLGGAVVVAVITAYLTWLLTGRHRREDRRLLLLDQRRAALVEVLAQHHAWSGAVATALAAAMANRPDVNEVTARLIDQDATFNRALEHARLLLPAGDLAEGLERVQRLTREWPRMATEAREAALEAVRTGVPLDRAHPVWQAQEAWGGLLVAECDVLRALGILHLS